jgi:hypothetical protein
MKKRITMTIDEETLDRLLEAAKEDRRSLSNMARVIIDLGLDTRRLDMDVKPMAE